MSQILNQGIYKQIVQDSQVYLQKGDDYYIKQDYPKSMKMYDFVIKLNPQYYQAYINKGKLFNALRRYEEAQQMFDKAFELNSQDYQVHLNRGNSFFFNGNYEKAIQLYDRAIQFNPKDSEVYLKKGDSIIALGKMEIALDLFNQAIQFKPNKKEYITRGDKYYEEKKYEQAIKFYDLLMQIDQKEGHTKKGQSLIALGNKLVEEKKYEEAIKIFDQLILINPKEGYIKKGDVLISQKKYEGAFKLFNEAIQHKPDESEFISRGDKYLKQRNVQEALKYYDLLIKLNPLQGHFKKGDILMDLEKNEEAFQMFNETVKSNKDQEEYLSRGNKYFQQQKYNEAIYFYEFLIRLNPRTGYQKKGDTLLILGKIEEAFEMFNQSLKYDSEIYDFIQRGDKYLNLHKFEIAFKLYDLGLNLVESWDKSIFSQNFLVCRKFQNEEKYFQELKYEDAIIFYDVMIKLNPTEGYLKKGDRLITLGRVKEAFENFDEAIKYNLGHDQYLKRGDKFLEEKKYDVALQFYDLLIKLYPKTGYIRKGDILLSLGKFEEGFQMFDEGIKHNPNYTEYLDRGDKYFDQKDYEDAIKFYDMLIKINPKVGYIKKGDIWFTFGKIEEGLQMFEEAIKHNPHTSQYINRAEKYLKENNLDVALKFYDFLIKLSPLEGYFKKGDMLLGLGKIEEAFEIYNAAITSKPNQSEFIQRGYKYFVEKQYQIALKFYDLLIKLNPREGYLKKGDTLIAQEKFEVAFEIFNQAILFNPNKYEYINRGELCVKQKRYEDAFKFYDLLIKIDPKIGSLKKGEALIAQGKVVEAIQMFNEVIQYKSDEHDYPIKTSFADKLYAYGKINEAIKFYQREDNAMPHSNLKYMLLLNRRFKEAETLNCKKYTFDQKNPWQYHQGLIRYEQGIYDNVAQNKNNVGLQLVKYK